MTAGEIISEIEQLAPGEQARVITFVRDLTPLSQLNSHELTLLAEELANASDPRELQTLKDRIVAGFYGET